MAGAPRRLLAGLHLAPWLRGYERAWLSSDVVAGLAAGAVVIPQAMAYATIAGLPVEVGLYTCMVPMAVYALVAPQPGRDRGVGQQPAWRAARHRRRNVPP